MGKPHDDQHDWKAGHEPEETEDDDTFDETFDGYNWGGPIEIILHYDAAGEAHCEDGPAATRPSGTNFWYWHGRIFKPNHFDESWPDDKKVWWMRAKLEGAT